MNSSVSGQVPIIDTFLVRLKRIVLGCIFLWTSLGSDAVFASPQADFSAICDASANFASRSTGVPIAVLRTITRTETGRRRNRVLEPWPWTVNMEGKGVWFENRQEALAYVTQHFQRGARSFDVGCFQLNYKWHGQAFSSVEEMFDPNANAVYAAKFLRDLFEEKGNWADAAGAYHSRTPKYAHRYIRRFNELYAGIANLPAPPPPANEPPATLATNTTIVRVNRFPLLQGAGTAHASLGSLMPATAGQGGIRLFGGG